MNIHSFSGIDDLQRIIDLRRTCTTAENASDYPMVSDLPVLLDTSNMQENARLWEDSERRLIAYAIVHFPYCNLYFLLHPQAKQTAIATQMISWATERIRAFQQQSNEQATLDTNCRDTDSERKMLLEQHGFILQPEQTLHMVRSLTVPIPQPGLPEGFTLRHLEGEHEAAAYIELHQAAFGTKNMTVEHRVASMRNSEYIPELDLIAVAPDSTLAAFCVCSIPQEANMKNGRNEGEIAIIGTHPMYRNKGLGKAMLLAGLQHLKTYGIDTAVLGTSSQNIDAHPIFRSVGFQIAHRTLWYAKNVLEYPQS